MSLETPKSADGAGTGKAGRSTVAAFAATTFLSAFLLFLVQPMFAKMVLPILGGAPSVWAVALVFFQGALLVGYAYADVLVRRLPLSRAGAVHLIACAAAFLFLPIALPAGWGDPPTVDPYFWQLGLFAAAIGVPFVVLAAHAPLLQAWLHRAGSGRAQDPYFLYAASNLGSLLALLGYPFVFEPAFGLTQLSRVWTWLFALLVAAVAGLYLLVRRAPDEPVVTGADAALDRPGAAASGRLVWIWLAFVPSALLTAFTTHVATDIASAPLIWVLPLAIYLLTFVVAFRERALIAATVLGALHVAAVALALLQVSQLRYDYWWLTSGIGATAFGLSALVAHRSLYEARPPAARLTEFYFAMSLGGVLGGLFSALVAPRVFSEVLEYPLLLALSLGCHPGLFEPARRQPREWAWIAGILAAGAGLIAVGPQLAEGLGLDFGVWGATPVVALACAVPLLVFWRDPARRLAAGLAMLLAVATLPSTIHRGPAQRSYFGVYRVLTSDDGQFHVLLHGTTMHGAQRIRDSDGKSVVDTTPATYYHPRGGMAMAVRMTQQAAMRRSAPARVGIVGLGAGSLACYALDGDSWRFFEIDPLIADIARSPSFTYLAHCQPKADIILGDARLTLAREQDASFDLLVIDAFSSDAVPVHLLTAEALALYLAKLKPGGLLALHITNRYFDLEPVIAATIERLPALKAFVVEVPGAADFATSHSLVVLLSADLATLQPFMRLRGTRQLKWAGFRPWTDDSSDILAPLIANLYAGR